MLHDDFLPLDILPECLALDTFGEASRQDERKGWAEYQLRQSITDAIEALGVENVRKIVKDEINQEIKAQ